MMNRSEENQNGCREQTRNEDEGIDGILEELMAHVCDELCRFREEMQGDLMDRICGRCGLQQYTDRIREEYEKINNFDKSQTGQLMNRYRKITLCKDCRYSCKQETDRPGSADEMVRKTFFRPYLAEHTAACRFLEG